MVLREVCGRVVHGLGEGRTLGYPTINVAYVGTLHERAGVYAARCEIGDQSYQGAAVIGGDHVASHQPKFEMFLFSDELIDAYGKEAKIQLCEYISPLIKFDSTDDLIRKIEEDIVAVKNYFI